MSPYLKILIVASILLSAEKLIAQVNLVPNPSFESYTSCPVTSGQVSLSTGWSSPSLGTPDLFSSCSTNTDITTPSNAYGFQNPKSGNTYVGLYSYLDNNDFSEYIQVQLSNSLTSGSPYCISFHLNVSDSSSYYSSDIGIHLSNTPVFYNSNQTLSVSPVITNSTVIMNDKSSWKIVSFNYSAIGGEQYLVIGNFKNSISTSVTPASGASWVNGTYFLIDDVSLTPGQCVNSLFEGYRQDNPKIYPNPFHTEFKIEGWELQPYQIKIHSELYEIDPDIITGSNQTTVRLINAPEGLYWLEIRTNNKRYFNKILLKNQ